ncbi:ATP-dependent DNA helicase RecG [Chloroflexales bacterium ZM16-3]|nr:ATP-dependent DNA helicase RecG [Chloroflexales bacterium ZM16-3]
MQNPEHIIQLGKVLAAEQRRGCDDQATDDGLDRFLGLWQAGADGDLALDAVQVALTLLEDYGGQTIRERKERVAQAVEGLRGLFRGQESGVRSRESGVRSQESGDRPAAPVKKPRAKPKKPAEAQPPAPSPQPLAPSPQPADVQPIAPAKALSPGDLLDSVPGIGRKDVNAFKRMGLRTVEDLLYHFPHRYDDYSSQKHIGDLVVGSVETIVGEVTNTRLAGGPRPRVEVEVSDETGTIKAVFFGQPWLTRQLPAGKMIVLSGKVGAYGGVRQMTSPTWEPYVPDSDALIHTGRLVPVHPLTKGLLDRNARKVIKQVVDAVAPHLPEYLPEATLAHAGLLGLSQAISQIHFPESAETLMRARERLGFDEFLFIQIGVVQRKLLWQGELGYQLRLHEDVHTDLQSQLPFALTGAQQRSLSEIFADVARPVPMARLLQGDVGSGKTVVAAASLLQAIANGYQGALMAPTEILAEQHYKGLKKLLGRVRVPRQAKQEAEGESWRDRMSPEESAQLAEIKALLGMTVEDDMDGQGVRVALLTGSLGVKDRRRVLEGIAKGEVDLVVGTHALITESVQYHSLGLAVVDEQHRFGVEQRQRLRDKGFNPHLLVMTATPIPRTLTMTIYGDLDTSVLDELPPGRQVIRTRWVNRSDHDKVYRHMRKEIEKGRQAFVICPLVEESEKIDLPSAEEMYEKLQSEIFPDLRVALLHGKMLPREKDQIMVAFRDHAYDILVATAVIEVGIDIPNASTILIEGAERFGLSQLHQFRGRVGRGQHQSYCVLIPHKENDTSVERLEALAQTSDGFKLAEIDLRLRGPGEFFGTRQSGTPDLKVAQLADTRLLVAARTAAEAILADDPQLAKPEHALLKQKVDAFWVEARKVG